MPSITELIATIEVRPAMYIGQRSISCLAAFIDGWSYALGDAIDDGHVFRGFTQWLAAKYEISSNRSWDQVIRFHTSDEYGALLYFFELWNEYLTTQNVGARPTSERRQTERVLNHPCHRVQVLEPQRHEEHKEGTQ